MATVLPCRALPASSSWRLSANAAPKSFAKSRRTFPAEDPEHESVDDRKLFTVTMSAITKNTDENRYFAEFV